MILQKTSGNFEKEPGQKKRAGFSENGKLVFVLDLLMICRFFQNEKRS